MKFLVEYLVIIDARSDHCKTVSTFNCLLMSIDGVTVSDSIICYKDNSFGYEVKDGTVPHGPRYFDLFLTCTDISLLDIFESLRREVRTVLSKISEKPVEVLWDDVGLHYAQQAYPLIHNIENLMRLLITKFMLLNIGRGWFDKSVPSNVTKAQRRESTKGGNDFLYHSDFIQLANYLFSDYTSIESNSFADKIRTARSLGDLSLSELKELVPRSNWERYFSSIVACESDYLKKRWERLYELRNNVAHNRSINYALYTEIQNLASELGTVLHSAIDNLSRITISDIEKEEVAENIAVNEDSRYLEFLQDWNTLTLALRDLASSGYSNEEERKLFNAKGGTWRNYVNTCIRKHMLLSVAFKQDIAQIALYRNVIVQDPDANVPEEDLQRLRASIAQALETINQAKQRISTNAIELSVAGETAEQHHSPDPFQGACLRHQFIRAGDDER